MVDYAGFARVIVIHMNAGARLDEVLVDLFASFVHVANAFIEHVTKGAVCALRADYDYFAWLIRRDRAGGSFHPRWLSSCGLVCARRVCLRKGQRRDQRAGKSVDYFLHHECLPFLR